MEGTPGGGGGRHQRSAIRDSPCEAPETPRRAAAQDATLTSRASPRSTGAPAMERGGRSKSRKTRQVDQSSHNDSQQHTPGRSVSCHDSSRLDSARQRQANSVVAHLARCRGSNSRDLGGSPCTPGGTANCGNASPAPTVHSASRRPNPLLGGSSGKLETASPATQAAAAAAAAAARGGPLPQTQSSSISRCDSSECAPGVASLGTTSVAELDSLQASTELDPMLSAIIGRMQASTGELDLMRDADPETAALIGVNHESDRGAGQPSGAPYKRSGHHRTPTLSSVVDNGVVVYDIPAVHINSDEESNAHPRVEHTGSVPGGNEMRYCDDDLDNDSLEEPNDKVKALCHKAQSLLHEITNASTPPVPPPSQPACQGIANPSAAAVPPAESARDVHACPANSADKASRVKAELADLRFRISHIELAVPSSADEDISALRKRVETTQAQLWHTLEEVKATKDQLNALAKLVAETPAPSFVSSPWIHPHCSARTHAQSSHVSQLGSVNRHFSAPTQFRAPQQSMTPPVGPGRLPGMHATEAPQQSMTPPVGPGRLPGVPAPEAATPPMLVSSRVTMAPLCAPQSTPMIRPPAKASSCALPNGLTCGQENESPQHIIHNPSQVKVHPSAVGTPPLTVRLYSALPGFDQPASIGGQLGKAPTALCAGKQHQQPAVLRTGVIKQPMSLQMHR